MNAITSNVLRYGGAVVAAGAGIGAVALATRASGEGSGQRTGVSAALAAVGGAAVTGALLLRGRAASTPLLGAGLGLVAAGGFDAARSAIASRGSASPPRVTVDRLEELRDGDLLPDGVQAAPNQLYREGNEVRFDSVVGNQGAAPLQLALHFDEASGSSRTTQVVFNEDGTAAERELQGGLRLDERRDHSHLHFDDFVYFQLYRADESGQTDVAAGEISGGVKQSFYITDIQPFAVADPANRAAADKLANKGRVDRNILPADVMQGISVGMADVYGAGLQGQSLSLGDAKAGRYVLRETFDPSDEVLEQDERNNVMDTVFEVGADGKVTKLESSFVPAEQYVTLADGRIVVPAVKDSLDGARSAHGDDHAH
jgi:hypothetical protein